MNLATWFKNYRTTIGGILLSVPELIKGAGFTPSPTVNHFLLLMQGIGGLILGLAAKDAVTHSSQAEVTKATVDAANDAAKAAAKS